MDGDKVKSERIVIKLLVVLVVISVSSAIGVYILNFSDSNISKDPSNWGVLGDYFGGVLNPLISLVTLIFLIKTYLSQKEELHQSEIEAKEQRKISQKTVEMQLLNTKISTSYELISLYKAEMDGVTLAINSNLPYGRNFIAINGREYSPDEAKKYRSEMARTITKELENISRYLEQL